MAEPKDELLRNYLARLNPSGGLEAMAETPSAARAEAAPGPDAAEPLKKLALGQPLNPDEQFFVEALIIPEQRPAIDIINGDYQVSHPRWLGWNDDSFRQALRPTFRSVGRIELPGHPQYPYGGTGFVVGEGLLMTNRHVAQLFCSGLGLRGLDFLPGVQAGVDFLRERDRPDRQFLRVTKTVMVHPYWDMALLQVEGLQADQRPLQLDTRDCAEHQGKEIAVIGYPAFDPRNDATLQNKLFNGVYGIKRLMPGLLGARLAVDSFEQRAVSAVGHDSSTLGGASGSAVLDSSSGLVLGLHFAGQYLISNYAVPAFELARDSRVVDAGVNFSGSVLSSPPPWNTAWQGHEQPVPSPVATPRQPVPPATASLALTPTANVEQTITIPLQISIRLGQAQLDVNVQASPTLTTPTAPTAPIPLGALSTARQQLLSLYRARQAAADQRPQRFVLNFATPPQQSDDAISQEIAVQLGLRGRLEPLFQPDAELDRHRLLELPGLTGLERDALFELARLLREITGADTVDPDVASDYYLHDASAPAPGIEGVDFPFWCWAGDDQLPDNADWAITATHTPEAWAFSEQQGKPSRGEGICVFQPDTGIVRWHTELPPGLERNPGAVNLLEPGNPPVDPMNGGQNPGHGTGTCSVVVSPEAGKMRGSAPKATLVPVRCLESVAVFNQSNVARAIDHARRNGAHVITMSLGGVFSDALHTALSKAVGANIIVVAAAGNCVPSVVWPARYEEAIAVGGINVKFEPWRGSSHGKAVDISGPAEFVQRASAGDYNNPSAVSGGQGTSFATAHLAGVAALWLAHHGRDALINMLPRGITLQQLFRTLVAAAAQVPPGFNHEQYGAGITQAEQLLKLSPSHAFTQESVFRAPATDLRGQVLALLGEAAGAAGVEAALVATDDPQNLLELACTALDRLRLQHGQRAKLESLPPLSISPGLRQALGAGALTLSTLGGASVP